MTNMNYFPTASDSAIMEKFPGVRRMERDALIQQVHWREHFKVADIQSAGGFVSDGVYQMQHGKVECHCIEPCDALRNRLKPVHHPVPDPVENFPHPKDQSMGVALGLAAQHDSDYHLATLQEARRVLKEGEGRVHCDRGRCSPDTSDIRAAGRHTDLFQGPVQPRLYGHRIAANNGRILRHRACPRPYRVVLGTVIP